MSRPSLESVKQHPLPAWYAGAKFGIFIHWTAASVPAFAARTKPDLTDFRDFDVVNSPYAEWYLNGLRIPGSAAHTHHLERYGADYSYDAFTETFKQQVMRWDPQPWAELFERAGARYVVFVTKHHDGFLLWPSRTPNPLKPGYGVTRDLVGELTEAVSARGMKMGLYYSSALDWTFPSRPLRNLADVVTSGPTSREYRAYVNAHWRELIERYAPWVLWSDIGYPPRTYLPALFAYYYEHMPEGVVNDRWLQLPAGMHNWLGSALVDRILRSLPRTGQPAPLPVPHCDYYTTEYAEFGAIPPFKWEATRGIGNSFGYNQFETDDDFLKAPELIRLLVDIVSKNGNLLLNVGPRPDGSIPAPQVAALEGIGAWLAVNGSAVYGSRPWTRPQDAAEDGGEVRYTQKDGVLYVIVRDMPAGNRLVLPDLPAAEGSEAVWVATGERVAWSRGGGALVVELPVAIREQVCPVVRFRMG